MALSARHRLITIALQETTLASEAEPQNLQNAHDETARRIELFAERLFARIPADLADAYPDHRRRSIAAGAYEFFAGRREPVAVRVAPCPFQDGVVVAETAMADRPFIVDSILEFFHKRAIAVRLMLHPRFDVARDASGALLSFEQAVAGEHAESYTRTEFRAPAAAHAEIERGLLEVLNEVCAATDDFEAMRDRAREICDETAALRSFVEIREFLRWLAQDAFIFLGYRRYRMVVEDGKPALAIDAGASLGVMRGEERSRYARPVRLDAMDEDHRTLLFDGPPLIVGKARAESRVHRRAALDDVTIRRTGASGETTGFDRFIGLFTSRAYAEEAQHVPVLRAKLEELLEGERVEPGTHDYKELIAVFNSFPKEELFRARTAELRSQLRMVLEAKTEGDIRLSLNTDSVRGNVIALVIMPREHFSAEVRVAIQDALGARLGGKLIYYYLALGEGYTARLHFCFSAPAPTPATVAAMEADVVRLARTWEDALCDRLTERHGHDRAAALFARWAPAFSAAYRSSTPVETAARDIDRFEVLLAGGAGGVEIHTPPPGGDGRSSELRMYELAEAPILSELVPTLQNFGVSVLSEAAHDLTPAIDGERRLVHVQSFRIAAARGEPLDTMPGAALLAAALAAVRDGLAVDDQLNQLTLTAGLEWREAALVRAYLSAAFQMKLTPARLAANRPFTLYPRLARLFVDWFRERFDPDRAPRDERLAELRSAYLEQCAAIENIADDRFARTLLALAEATVRTNFFRDPDRGEPHIALKFASGRIPNLPDAAPLYEIHVCGPRMEGCHLRDGKIARGGIRHSDRPDDFRTEILDLMKTQTVKNVMIVPVGAKGGFVVKPRVGRALSHEDAVAAYRTLIGAMLDLTGNVVDGKTVAPPRVRAYDDDGPYLVVAADKGTAAYSDIANEIAVSRGFWLGDAFASGGEHGYDHKRMGITARGAWESAKRHLRELGRDLEHGAPITMVGVGDMSGDVFGNGLLRSENVKLIAAFDHRHIFIDPDPDPKRSFAERKRLYDKPNSQWSDYDAGLISAGGGVYRRGQKKIALSAEARRALGCDAAEIDADSLVQAILRAPVDMLYNGGIGSYVRASGETDAEVGDHANDNVRITAAELRCKIVVEGGNLGFTQRARIEYALAGGRINSDAIDNSAGVDTSDHEVNLKILLAPMVARGALAFEERNRRLAAAVDDVAESVLADNYDQALSLSLEQARTRAGVHAWRDHLTALEQRGVARRGEWTLPSHEELRDRRARYSGLTRPELALLAAFTKIDLTRRLERAALIEDAYLVERFLRPYFPASIARDFAGAIPVHGLRRELVATRVVNELVDLTGSVFIFNLTRDHGIEAEDAIRAWLAASGVLDLRARVLELKRNAAELSAQAEVGAFLGLERIVRRVVEWAIEHSGRSGEIGAIVDRYAAALPKLAGEFEDLLAGGERARFEASYRELRAAVHQEQLAHELARLEFAGHLLNILSLAFDTGRPPLDVARAYFALSERIEFARLESAIESLSSEDRWERRAARDLANELIWSRNQLCRSILDGAGASAPIAERIAKGRERRAAEVERLMGELRSLASVGLPPLQVTVRAVARLAANV